MDINYRGIINRLGMCGCVGQSGGGWSHYVGQEKLRPQTGWTALAFALDWNRPPRHMNSTSFFYAHTDQWRYRSEEHTSELQSLMRISYAVFCLKKKKNRIKQSITPINNKPDHPDKYSNHSNTNTSRAHITPSSSN